MAASGRLKGKHRYQEGDAPPSAPPFDPYQRNGGRCSAVSCQGVVTEEMMEVGKTYQLVSADGKRILRASNTKAERGYKVHTMSLLTRVLPLCHKL